MGLLKLLGALSPVHISWFTWKNGTRVGEDQFGNIYYTAKPYPGYKRERRWVIYNGEPEASKVPPEWHGWLHHQSDLWPGNGSEVFRQKWQKPHQPNKTGTDQAYCPPCHSLKEGHSVKVTGDYEPWNPAN